MNKALAGLEGPIVTVFESKRTLGPISTIPLLTPLIKVLPLLLWKTVPLSWKGERSEELNDLQRLV